MKPKKKYKYGDGYLHPIHTENANDEADMMKGGTSMFSNGGNDDGGEIEDEAAERKRRREEAKGVDDGEGEPMRTTTSWGIGFSLF